MVSAMFASLLCSQSNEENKSNGIKDGKGKASSGRS